MSLRSTLAALLAVSASLVAQPLRAQTAANLSGTIVDTAGAPVAGATVKLEKLGLTATSGANGSFTLGSATSLKHLVSGAGTSRLEAGALRLSLAAAAPVTVTAHALDGRALAATTRLLGAGEHRVALPGEGTGIRLYRVRIGSREEIIRAVELPGASEGSVAFTSAGMSAAGSATLAKSSAGTPLYDAISATKTGYLKSYVSISVSDSSGIKVVLLPSAFPKFSFFVVSQKAMQELSGNDSGFGGDFRFGETGAGAGLRGADKICATVAERSLKNAKYKGWRAFLSVKSDPYGQQANAIDRVGEGPWHDRVGRVMAPTKADLANQRPANGDAAIRNDLPNEDGIPNQQPDPNLPAVDNHHTLTGSTTTGTLYSPNSPTSTTCEDWTTNARVTGVRPRTGWSWSIQNRIHWISGSDEGGCGKGYNLVQNGGANFNNPIVGSGGGYGGYYCFALTP
jgi:hypothetical protein